MEPGTTAKNGHRDTLILDGQNFLFRAHYAHQRLATSEGVRTSCYHGVMTMLQELIQKFPLTDIVVVWDHFLPRSIPTNGVHTPDFKRELGKGIYKAGRQKSDESLEALRQGERLVTVLDNLGFLQLGVPGLEADDLIGIVATALAADASCRKVDILSGDRDMLQLVSDKINALTPKNGATGFTRWTPEVVEREYGLPPRKFAKYLALGGDTSDNYKAIRGIGPKKARELVVAGLDPSYKSFSELPLEEQKRWKLYEGKWETIYLCYKLAYIPRNPTYKLLPKTVQDMAAHCVKLAVTKRRRRLTSGQLRVAEKRYDEFCDEFELGFLRSRKDIFLRGIEVI